MGYTHCVGRVSLGQSPRRESQGRRRASPELLNNTKQVRGVTVSLHCLQQNVSCPGFSPALHLPEVLWLDLFCQTDGHRGCLILL